MAVQTLTATPLAIDGAGTNLTPLLAAPTSPPRSSSRTP